MRELTDERLQLYRDTAERLELEGRGLLYADADLIRAVCNGIGADWMPSQLRAVLDTLHPAFVLPSVIHDLQYYYWDGSLESLDRCNRQFASNCRRMAADRYGLLDPRRWIACLSARRYRRILDAFGRTAAEAAKKRRETMRKRRPL